MRSKQNRPRYSGFNVLIYQFKCAWAGRETQNGRSLVMTILIRTVSICWFLWRQFQRDSTKINQVTVGFMFSWWDPKNAKHWISVVWVLVWIVSRRWFECYHFFYWTRIEIDRVSVVFRFSWRDPKRLFWLIFHQFQRVLAHFSPFFLSFETFLLTEFCRHRTE